MAGRPVFSKFIPVLITKTKHPASPSGLVLFYCFYRGLHPPLYPVGLSGLTLMYRKFKRTCSGKARLATILLKVAERPDLMFRNFKVGTRCPCPYV